MASKRLGTAVPAPSAAWLTAESTQLAQHLDHCAQASGAMHRLRCAVELADGHLGARFVSTLAVLAVLLAGVAAVLHRLVA